MTSHHCPACGARLPVMARHPWYICALCRERITDGEGYLLEFANTSHLGGFAWRRAGETEFRVAEAFIGLLDGRPVRVSAARFGGIVAEPASVAADAVGPMATSGDRDGA
jgi:hypothetical protein